MPSSTTKRSCPCKYVSHSLSSFTAAEHGNVQALIAQQQKRGGSAGRKDSVGNSPLHLAAQHGHVAATAFLLQQTENNHFRTQESAAVTPLHRASFSGAVSTMMLLLSANSQELNAKDYLLKPDSSFGDGMTALHKAASGGRYLAVGLLLDALSEQGCLREGLIAKDSRGKTPRDVAVEKRQTTETERQSVARWNDVAGGFADWDKCVQLLRTAGFRVNKEGDEAGKRAFSSFRTSIPVHLTTQTTTAECLDCTEDGRCMTSTWEDSFRLSLSGSVNSALPSSEPFLGAFSGVSATTEERQVTSKADPSSNLRDVSSETSSRPTTHGDEFSVSENNTESLGERCAICQLPSIALYKRNDLLVCKKCRQPRL